MDASQRTPSFLNSFCFSVGLVGVSELHPLKALSTFRRSENGQPSQPARSHRRLTGALCARFLEETQEAIEAIAVEKYLEDRWALGRFWGKSPSTQIFSGQCPFLPFFHPTADVLYFASFLHPTAGREAIFGSLAPFKLWFQEVPRLWGMPFGFLGGSHCSNLDPDGVPLISPSRQRNLSAGTLKKT